MAELSQFATFKPAQPIGNPRSDEDRLIAKVHAGEMEAFNDLVTRHQDSVYQLVYRILGDEAAASDAAQEAFIAAYRRLYTFQAGSFRSWLYRIAINKCYDALRAHRRRLTVPLDELTDDRGESVHDLTAAHNDSPETIVQQQELANLLQRHIANLPSDQRTVLVLSDVHGLSYGEIAAITRLRFGTVKSRLSRGRARLRDNLAPLLPHLRSI
jgi:RNA polymerase sigma-70 factor (ECF subfamily)